MSGLIGSRFADDGPESDCGEKRVQGFAHQLSAVRDDIRVQRSHDERDQSGARSKAPAHHREEKPERGGGHEHDRGQQRVDVLAEQRDQEREKCRKSGRILRVRRRSDQEEVLVAQLPQGTGEQEVGRLVVPARDAERATSPADRRVQHQQRHRRNRNSMLAQPWRDAGAPGQHGRHRPLMAHVHDR